MTIHPRQPSLADPDGSFDITIDIDDVGSARLRLRGELDRATRPMLDAVIRNLQEVGISRVLLDAGGLLFTDSTIVDVVESWRVLAVRRGGEVRLVHVPAHVRRVVELLDADALIDDDAPTEGVGEGDAEGVSVVRSG